MLLVLLMLLMLLVLVLLMLKLLELLLLLAVVVVVLLLLLLLGRWLAAWVLLRWCATHWCLLHLRLHCQLSLPQHKCFTLPLEQCQLSFSLLVFVESGLPRRPLF